VSGRNRTVAERLAEPPKRDLGCANEIASEALHSPDVLRSLVAAVEDKRAVVSIRAANALRKVQLQRPALLEPHARAILHAATLCQELRTRWNLIQVAAALPLRGRDAALAVDLLFEALGSESGFLRAFALTGLVQLACENAALRLRVGPMIETALDDASAAVRARARKLTKLLAST
jgi:hypothetical protein